MTHIRTTKQLREVAGRYGSMFDPDTMRWWNSTLLPELYPVTDLIGYFITSDGTPGENGITDGPKVYVIRRYEWKLTDGDSLAFETALKGGHEAQFRTLKAAKAAAQVIAAAEKTQGYAVAHKLGGRFATQNENEYEEQS